MKLQSKKYSNRVEERHAMLGPRRSPRKLNVSSTRGNLNQSFAEKSNSSDMVQLDLRKKIRSLPAIRSPPRPFKPLVLQNPGTLHICYLPKAT